MLRQESEGSLRALAARPAGRAARGAAGGGGGGNGGGVALLRGTMPLALHYPGCYGRGAAVVGRAAAADGALAPFMVSATLAPWITMSATMSEIVFVWGTRHLPAQNFFKTAFHQYVSRTEHLTPFLNFTHNELMRELWEEFLI